MGLPASEGALSANGDAGRRCTAASDHGVVAVIRRSLGTTTHDRRDAETDHAVMLLGSMPLRSMVPVGLSWTIAT
jgi:hypothetical protein